MPNFDKFLQGQSLTAKWVNMVSTYLTNLTITGDGGISVAKKDNGFCITNQISPSIEILYTYELDDEGYPYDESTPQEYRCIHSLTNPPTEADDTNWRYVKIINGSVPRNTRIIAFKIKGEWWGFWDRGQISGTLSQNDNGDWICGGEQIVSIPYDSNLGDWASWAASGPPVTAEWRDASGVYASGYYALPPRFITATLSENLTAHGIATAQTNHWFSSGVGFGISDEDFECQIVNPFNTAVDSGTEVTAFLSPNGCNYVLISTDC